MNCANTVVDTAEGIARQFMMPTDRTIEARGTGPGVCDDSDY
jgi:hypothetical protein